ncbi:MAG: 3-dehydroquinate synthase [Candidatus Omnitrophota bacterium]
MKRLCVNLGDRSYDIIVCGNDIARLGRIIKQLKIGKDAIIITNAGIKRLLGDRVKKTLLSSGFSVKFQIVPDSEKAKSEKHCARLLNNIARFDGLRRRVFIIALGGGVVGDLAGFVASIYKRGVPYLQVPTTLLAQVDSSIGGKVAIDLGVGKNLAGSFYQPRLVFSDVSILKTLPEKELISGIAEIIKYGIIKSPGLFSFLEKNLKKILRRDANTLKRIVYESGSIKASIVEKDERDNKDMRVILNLGHTIGHAIETAAGYNKAYGHGQAIALGMLAASYISMRLKLLKEADYSRIKALIKDSGLPTVLKGLKVKDIIAAQEHDKKFIRGRNRFVLPVRIGKTMIKENIPESLIKESIKSLLWT